MPRFLKPGLFLVCLLPLVAMVWLAVSDRLGPDPGEALMHISGEWSARILILTLLVSPLRQWTGRSWWLSVRRMLGLYAFFYACLHLLVFLQLFIGWSWTRVGEELLERPYITAGFAAWFIMLPLAITSTRGMQRRLARNWRRLHWGIYPVAVAVSLHILWQARSDIGEALVYAIAFGGLLGWRIYRRFSRA